MDRSIEELIHVLQQCEELYHDMLSLLELEKKAALSQRPDEIVAINEEKQALLAQLKVMDHRRAALLTGIAAQMELSEHGLTMSALIESTTSSYRSQLETVYAALHQIVAKVQRANNESRLLVTHCLDLVKNTLGFFHRWTSSPAVYGASGHMKVQGSGYGWKLSNSV